TQGTNMSQSSRRNFLKAAAGTACTLRTNLESLAASDGNDFTMGQPYAGLTPPQKSKERSIQKGVLLEMLPAKLTFAQRFQLAKDPGFDIVQAPTTPDQHAAEEIKKAAEQAHIRIDSVMNMAHWEFPLSSSDPAVVEKSLSGMRTSLHNAKLWGSDAV